MQLEATTPTKTLAERLIDEGGVIRLTSFHNRSEEELIADVRKAEAEGTLDASVVTLAAKNIMSVWPKVGMGVTELYWTDREPFEVVAVAPDGTWCDIRPMKATPDPNWKRDFTPGGFVGHTHNDHELKYVYESMPGASTKRIRLCKGGWARKTMRYRMGRAIKFYDSNF